MVNTGRPSRGCISCRRTRVKCDETRPNCKRCIRLNLECVWKDEWTSVVRHQEKWAEGKVAKRVERVQMKRNGRHLQRISNVSPHMAARALRIPKQCQIGPDVYAINRFYADYAFTNGTCPFLYLVAPLYLQEKTPDCLRSVVPAVALASSAKQLHRHDLMMEARRHYGEAVTTLNRTLSDPVLVKHDATLLTVFLLGLYEFITTDRLPGLPSPYHAHGPGRLALLRLRGPEQLDTKTGRHLFTLLYHEQLISSFLGNGELMDEFPAWMHEHYPPTPLKSMKLLMHEISCLLVCFKKALLRSKRRAKDLTSVLQKAPSTPLDCESHPIPTLIYQTLELAGQGNHGLGFYENIDTLLPLLRKGIIINEALGNLDIRFQPGWPKEADVINWATGKDRPGDSPYSSNQNGKLEEDISVYIGISRTVTLNVYRAMQIHLLRTLIDALPAAAAVMGSLSNLSFDLPSLQAEWTATIARLAGIICDDVPYALGEYDKEGRQLKTPIAGYAFRAYLMLWPLRVSLDAKETPPDYKERITRRLKYISNVIGIGMAGEMAQAEQNNFAEGRQNSDNPCNTEPPNPWPQPKFDARLDLSDIDAVEPVLW